MAQYGLTDKGDPKALRLEFQRRVRCGGCRWDYHILYHFHRRLLCHKCLKRSGVPYVKVTRGGVTLYKLVRLKGAT